MSTIASLVVKIGADVEGLRRGLSSVQDQTQRVSSSVRDALGGALRFGLAGATAGFLTLGAGIGTSVNSAADLQAQMSDVRAAMGLTAEETAALKEEILDLGVDPNLKVSAMEAAEAIEALGRNGLTTTEILDGAAESTVLLSNATGGAFAQSADIATDVMRLWGIEADHMIDAVNGITATTINSKFTIDDYALALAQGGGVAASVGVEFDDFNASIAAISPLFASGSDAGTSFKTFLQRLIPTTGPASEAMHELGLMTFEAERAMTYLAENGIEPVSNDFNQLIEQLRHVHADQQDLTFGTLEEIEAFQKWSQEIGLIHSEFFDANGQMRSMAEITGILHEATTGLSEEQKNQAFATIFGTDAMRAAFGIAEMTEEEFRALQATMAQTDAVAAAATRMDNLTGSMEILGGVVETVQIQVGEQFLPIITEGVRGFSGMLTANSDQIVAFFGQLAVIIAIVAQRVSGFVAAVQSGLPVGSSFVNLILTLLAELGVAPSVVNRVAAVLWTLHDFLAGTLPPAIQFVISHAREFGAALLGIGAAIAIVAVLGAIAGALAAIANPITLVIAAAGLLAAAWAGNWGGIQEKTAAVWAFLQPIFTAIGQQVEQVRATFQSNWPTISAVVQTAWIVIQAIIASALSVIEPSLQLFFDAIQRNGDKFREIWQMLAPILGVAAAAIGAILVALVAVFSATFTGIALAVDPFVEMLRRLAISVNVVFEGVKTTLSGALLFITGLFQGNGDMIRQAWQMMSQGVEQITLGLKLAVLSIVVGLVETGAAFIYGFVQGVIQFFQNLYNVLVGNSIVPDMVIAIIFWFASLDDQARAIVNAMWQALQAEFNAARTNVTTTVSGLWSDAETRFNTAKTTLTTTIGGLWTDLETRFTTAKTNVTTVIDGLWTDVKGLFDTAKTDLVAGAQSIGDGIANAISNAVNTVVGNIRSTLNEVIRILNAGISQFNQLPGPDLPMIPELAKGTTNFEGGLALVGELGPELVSLPRGSRVYPAAETRGMLAAGGAGGARSETHYHLHQTIREETAARSEQGFATLKAWAGV